MRGRTAPRLPQNRPGCLHFDTMNRHLRTAALVGQIAVMLATGCGLRESEFRFGNDLGHFEELIVEASYPDQFVTDFDDPSLTTQPLGADTQPRQPWLLTVEDAVQIALANSPVLRDLGGSVLRSPENTRTIHAPAIRETDPRFGVEAALSAFDAQLASTTLFENNDFAVNNRFLGGGANVIKQDLMVHRTEITKRAATGSTFTARHNMDYDSNNAPGNLFPSAWRVNYEAEVRHPLLQGAGVEFNRIAGPNGTPGAMNGVLIARLNSDISVADFAIGLRDLVSNVENAYWDLYFAYRDLESKHVARDAALTTWRRVQALAETDDKEAQAREQYFRYQEEVETALSGRIVEGTESYNGSSGGTFRGSLGVYVAERRLRLLLGIPINDAYVIRPARDPVIAKVVFDWNEIAREALYRREEIRQQMLRVKRRELELAASRNFLLPRVDAIGRYRWRGFGDDLLHPDRDGRPRFDNAYMDLTSGDFQEWQLGVEVIAPFGFRQAHAAVRNAQLELARERMILREQERQVVHDLSNAVADMHRAYQSCQTAFNRRVAARKQLAVLEEREKVTTSIDVNATLDAQRRAADADSRYFRALVEYSMAIKNVQFEKGTLLEYNDVYLADTASVEETRPHDSHLQPTLATSGGGAADAGSEPIAPIPNPEILPDRSAEYAPPPALSPRMARLPAPTMSPPPPTEPSVIVDREGP